MCVCVCVCVCVCIYIYIYIHTYNKIISKAGDFDSERILNIFREICARDMFFVR